MWTTDENRRTRALLDRGLPRPAGRPRTHRHRRPTRPRSRRRPRDGRAAATDGPGGSGSTGPLRRSPAAALPRPRHRRLDRALHQRSYAEVVAARPDRFRAFAALPMPHVEESITEIERVLDGATTVGVVLNTTILDQPLVDPRFAPVLAELDRRAAVVYLHPAGNSACTPLIAEHHMTWMAGAPIEDTISVVQLITHAIPTRYPNLRIINSHLGGALPMLLQRLDNQYRWEAPRTPEPPSTTARRMWYDTVGHGHIPALRAAIDSLGSDRLLLGTDFPYENGEIFLRAIDHINDPAIDPAAAAMILDTNAAALLGLHHPIAATTRTP
ncbi:amidohydrolase family protein [Nocardia takedensis]|uniref:amidohydrolase family protein n=1 Tax=Nocardia takedensis TaxID=259390 RepID=UPI003F75B7EF